MYVRVFILNSFPPLFFKWILSKKKKFDPREKIPNIKNLPWVLRNTPQKLRAAPTRRSPARPPPIAISEIRPTKFGRCPTSMGQVRHFF